LTEAVVARLPNGQSFPFVVHRTGDSHVSPTIRTTGRWEPFATRILWSLLKPGDGVIDIGGNIGWYAAVFARAVGPNGWVHTFEPDPVNLALLRRNVEGPELAHVTVHPTALADRQGTMQLALSGANFGDHRLAPKTTISTSSGVSCAHGSVEAGGPSRHSVTVQVERLDDVIVRDRMDLGRLRVVKIDTQGAEAMILGGAGRLLAEMHPRTAWLVEYAPNLLAAHGPDEIGQFIQLMTATGRRIYALRRASMVPTDGDRLRRLATKLAPHGDEWAVDLLVVPDVRTTQRRLLRYRVPRPLRWV
jgi:FkbM family methyltransferase